MKLFTIGFTKKSAESFFTKLQRAGVKRLIDVRLNNVSQLAGFAKRDDLKYFLKAICNADYEHIPDLAPTQNMLDAYKKHGSADWSWYEREFLGLMKTRAVDKTLRREQFIDSCLLCSEHHPEHCHRRLVAEYLKEHWGNVDIEHLL